MLWKEGRGNEGGRYYCLIIIVYTLVISKLSFEGRVVERGAGICYSVIGFCK